MRKFNFILLMALLFASLHLSAQTKRALVIGIGDYPSYTGWSKINGDKDVAYVTEYLKAAHFSSIRTLVNSQATKANIVSAFNRLKNECRSGDIVYIHFSGHGQQMKDVNGDERDNLDECWIPYDACANPCKKDYGEKHLSDDEVNVLLTGIRKKVGAKGKILVVVDACHSENSTRGSDDEGVTRGIKEVFNTIVDKIKRKFLVTSKGDVSGSSNAELWITISACGSKQKNTELKNPIAGKLTYGIYSIIKNCKNATNDAFYNSLSGFMNKYSTSSPQKPVMSGTVNSYKITDILK